jgi:hypothetical protein
MFGVTLICPISTATTMRVCSEAVSLGAMSITPAVVDLTAGRPPYHVCLTMGVTVRVVRRDHVCRCASMCVDLWDMCV